MKSFDACKLLHKRAVGGWQLCGWCVMAWRSMLLLTPSAEWHSLLWQGVCGYRV